MIIHYENREERGWAEQTGTDVGGWALVTTADGRELALNPALTRVRQVRFQDMMRQDLLAFLTKRALYDWDFAEARPDEEKSVFIAKHIIEDVLEGKT